MTWHFGLDIFGTLVLAMMIMCLFVCSVLSRMLICVVLPLLKHDMTCVGILSLSWWYRLCSWWALLVVIKLVLVSV